jgi:hypothetical protein
MLLAFCSNSNGLWLAALFLGDAHYFNASFWSVAANVSKHWLKMQLYAFNTQPNSGLSGSGLQVNWNVQTKLCLDWPNTLFYLVYCSHKSISTVGMSFNACNRCSCTSAFQFSISWTIWLSTSSWLCSLLLLLLALLALGSESLLSLPVSLIAALQAWRS